MQTPILVDAHEDLAYNMLAFGRDYCLSAIETRNIEKKNDSPALSLTGETLLGWPEYQSGQVAVIFGTLFVTPARARLGTWNKQVYADYNDAHQLYWDQLDAYHMLTEKNPDKFRLIGTRAELKSLLNVWDSSQSKTGRPVGLVPLMEGAEGVRTPSELSTWWENGLRIIGLAWSGTRFCGGTREPGPLTDDGRLLLNEMANIGFILDISHMDELAARQALDYYPGPVIASHANAAAIIPGYEGNRHLSDVVIRNVAERDGVIGLVPYCRFLDARWKLGDRREDVPLDMVAAHIDHICQITGTASHVGLGTDFDGGFGLSSVPVELESIADLQGLVPILSARGYNKKDIISVLGGNWLRQLEENLP